MIIANMENMEINKGSAKPQGHTNKTAMTQLDNITMGKRQRD
jgi:hypothetical protein